MRSYSVNHLGDALRNIIKPRMVDKLSTVFLIASSLAMVYLIANYKQPQVEHFIQEEVITEKTVDYVAEETDPAFNIFDELGITYRRGFESADYCRYEVVTANYADIDNRLVMLTDALKKDGKNTRIFLLNHANEEQVIKLMENGEVIWEYN